MLGDPLRLTTVVVIPIRGNWIPGGPTEPHPHVRRFDLPEPAVEAFLRHFNRTAIEQGGSLWAMRLPAEKSPPLG